MNYPLISEYVEAIKAAEDNFDQLKHLRPVLDDDDMPVMSGGNFAVVFKMKDEQTGKLHAVKCFLKEQEGRAEAYRQIAEELEYVSSTFLTPIKYLDKELFVDSANSEDSEFPVLLMDWVEGQTLDKYIREHIDDQYELSLLAYQFSRLAMWLMPQPFAHGDLKPDNILVKEDGTLVLVDYDGMYVPAMKGQKARELGSPDFRHPGRTEEIFDDHIDDFSLASILLSLKAIALQSSLLEEYGASDRLLFSEKDYRNLSDSSALGSLQPLMQDAELASLYSLFILALSQDNLSQVSFRLFNLSRPEKPQYEEENFSTEVTDEDLANAWTDEFGVKYSRDRKRLLKASDSIKEYVINEGTKVICNKAFKGCKNLTSITIPNGVISIGESAFHHRNQLESIVIPNSVISIGRLAFFGCSGLTTLKLSENLRVIGERAFFSCARLSSIRVPSNVEQIGDSAFQGCIGLTSMVVDTQNITYDSRDYCHAIIETQSNTLLCGCRATIIPQGVVKIKDLAFVGIRGLKYIFIPDSVQEIGKCSFAYVSGIESIKVGKNNQYYDSRNNCNAIIETYSNTLLLGCPATLIPESVMRIGSFSFGDESDRAMSVNIPEGIKEIDERAFYNCLSLESIIIPDSVEKIGNEAFGRCQYLKEVRLSVGIMEIAKDLFADCIRLEDIEIPISVSKIGISAFYNCSLQEMTIPNGVKNIGDYAFNGCNNLVSIKFLSRIDSIGEGVFQRCNKLANIYIPVGTRQKYENMLPEYREILMEELTIENHKGHRRVFCKKELEVVNRAKVVQGQYTKLVCFYMNDGCQKYIPLCRQSHLSIGDEVDLNTAKLIKLSGEGIYYGYIDGREYYDNNLVDA